MSACCEPFWSRRIDLLKSFAKRAQPVAWGPNWPTGMYKLETGRTKRQRQQNWRLLVQSYDVNLIILHTLFFFWRTLLSRVKLLFSEFARHYSPLALGSVWFPRKRSLPVQSMWGLTTRLCQMKWLPVDYWYHTSAALVPTHLPASFGFFFPFIAWIILMAPLWAIYSKSPELPTVCVHFQYSDLTFMLRFC